MTIILALAHITIKFCFWFLLTISILPKKIVLIIIKNVKLFKKTGFILLIILLLLSIIASYLVLNYLDFFLINFDDICEYYIENKSK